jgi:hypothetical protein
MGTADDQRIVPVCHRNPVPRTERSPGCRRTPMMLAVNEGLTVPERRGADDALVRYAPMDAQVLGDLLMTRRT